MTVRTLDRKAHLYAVLSALALLLALILGQPALAALGAAFAAYLVIGVAPTRPADDVVAEVSVDRERAIEGDELTLTFAIASSRDCEAEIAIALPAGVATAEATSRMLRLKAGERREITFPLEAERWGAYLVGEHAVRVPDRFGFVHRSLHRQAVQPLRVYPRVEQLRALIAPYETQPFTGNRVARVKGEGIEFADIRPFATGDRVRRVNWRVSTRRGELYVNEAHPERNSDVVLFLDTFQQAGRRQDGTLDAAVRVAASLARAYLEQRDRVGVVGFGAVVRWLTPAMGRGQLYRIVDALLSSEISLSYAWKGLEVLPPRSLPPQSLVLALTPLLDERGVDALLDLRARGFDLAVLDISPVAFAAEARVDPLALRLWELSRQALRYRYERLGVPVVEWTPKTSVAHLLGEVMAFRRYVRRASA